MARNGLELTQTGRKIRVTGITTFSSDKLERASEINGSGKLVKKPDTGYNRERDITEGT